MEEKRFKQVTLDAPTHAKLTRLAKKSGRTRVGLIRWLLDTHDTPSKRTAA